MPDDVETLQKMVRWFAECMMSEEEAGASYTMTDSMWDHGVEDWINNARKGVTECG